MVFPPVSANFSLPARVERKLTRALARVIAFRFIPNSVVTRPVEAVWVPCVQTPFFKLPYMVRLTMGWLALLGIVFGSAFGFKLTGVSLPFIPLAPREGR